MAKQTINSVEVILQDPEGSDLYRVGSRLHPETTIIHRIEDESLKYSNHVDRSYGFYDEAGNVIMRIENCPVVVRYKPSSDS
jgi:hypothetical protein